MSGIDLPGALVSVSWLAQAMRENQASHELVILDASWHMPAAGRDGELEWRRERIPDARFFDFDRRICDRESTLPHMMPNAELFTTELRRLGINQNSTVIVYDSTGIFSSPRAWWMLQAMGLRQCAVLDGGLPAWRAAGHPLSHEHPEEINEEGNFSANYRSTLISDRREVLLATSAAKTCILDARSADRFYARAPEPRPGLRGGHMPGARNLPFDRLVQDGHMRQAPELISTLNSIVPASSRIIATCGSGVTSCVVAFGAHLAGYRDIAVYDGSWAEWGADNGLPVVSHD